MLVLAASSGCAPEICNYIYVVGMTVNVQDSQGMPVCDVTIRIQEGDYEEERALSPDSCAFSGAGERPGKYQVTALRGGVVVTETRVSLGADGCHVEHKDVTLTVND